MKSYDVYYPSQIDVAAWQSAYQARTKPDEWPYGLNQLARHATVKFQNIQRQRSVTAAAAALLPGRVKAYPHAFSPTYALPVTWDERTALDLYLACGKAPYGTGIIWATDQLRRPAAHLRTRLLRRVLRDANALWCLSTAQLGVLDEWLGSQSKSKSAQFLPFGIDTNFYSLRPAETSNLIFSVGGDRDRDPRTLFAALAAVIRANPDIKAVVQTTSSLQPPDGVEVVRRLSHAELREMYAKATVVAIATKPNLHVSGMTVSLEAAATGRPVVITKTPGMTDYVLEGKTGLLTPVGDSEAMAKSILNLLEEPGQLLEMGSAARVHAAQNHSSAKMASRLQDILEDGAHR